MARKRKRHRKLTKAQRATISRRNLKKARAARKNKRHKGKKRKSKKSRKRKSKKHGGKKRKHRGKRKGKKSKRGKHRGKKKRRRSKRSRVKKSVADAYRASLFTGYPTSDKLKGAEQRAKREAAAADHRASYLASLRKKLASRRQGSFAASSV